MENLWFWTQLAALAHMKQLEAETKFEADLLADKLQRVITALDNPF